MMTATLQTPIAPGTTVGVRPRPAPARGARLSFWNVLRSEWIKLWSVRSTPIMMAVVVAVLVGFGAMAAGVSTGEVAPPDGGGGGGPFASDPLSVAMVGTTFAVLLIGTLGALVGSREFTSGMIRTTVAAVPRRIVVLAAKAVTLTVALVPVVLLGVLGAFAVAMALLSGAGAATVTLGAAGWALVGTIGYLLGVGLLGLALGFLFRGIAGSISTLVGGLLLLPGIIALLLPASWGEVLKYLPSNAASSFTSITPPAEMLGVGAGVAVFLAWLVLALGAAGVMLRRRDV
jgi:ABC-type transport system involved in multi-copper enzyme maturation permease subunit